MDADRALRLVRTLVEIRSYSGQEEALARSLVKEMRELGFEGGLDEAGNAVGKIGDPSGPVIMLLGHMDTVTGGIPVRQEGRELWGRGSVDAKGALATFVMAAAAARDRGARLVVVGAVEEETAGSRGAKHLLAGEIPQAVVVGEPSGWDSAVLGYKGRISIIYEVSRPRAHSSRMDETAVDAALCFWSSLRDELAVPEGGRVFDRAVPSLRRVEGDAELARLEISCRTPVGFDMDGFVERVRGLAGGALIRVEEATPAILVERDNPVVRALAGAIRARGAQPRLKVKTGTSDMNVVGSRWSCPMAAYGPGDAALDHTAEERLDLDEYLRAIDVLADALGRLAGELPRPPSAEEAFTAEEEAELTERLQALGYLE